MKYRTLRLIGENLLKDKNLYIDDIVLRETVKIYASDERDIVYIINYIRLVIAQESLQELIKNNEAYFEE